MSPSNSWRVGRSKGTAPVRTTYRSAFAAIVIRAGTAGSGGILVGSAFLAQRDHVPGVTLGFLSCVIALGLRRWRPELAEHVFLGGCATSVWVASAMAPTAEGVGSAAISWLVLGIFGSLLLSLRALMALGLACLLGTITLIVRGGSVGLPIGSPGNIVAVVFVATGFVVLGQIAEHFRSSLNELERAEREARTALESKSRFLANMSHELRTPLNAILGYSELLQEEDETGETPELDRIHEAGSRLLGHIDALLDLSKIDAGRMQVFLEDVDISALVHEVVALVRPMSAKAGTRIVVEVAADLATRTDRTKVVQVLTNLLSNAIKFTQAGKITVRGGLVDGRVVLSVQDTGIGIAAEALPDLFEPFSQADASTTRRYGGTGLGLALVREFCTLLDADLDVDSEVGRGSTFTLTLAAPS